MSANPFAPPISDVHDASPRPGSLTKGLILGLLVDIGGTTVAGILIGVAFAVFMSKAGMSQEQIYAALSSHRFGTPIFIISTIAGTCCSVLGGYVCQRIAQRRSCRLALLLGSLSSAFGIAMTWSAYSLTWHILLTALTVGSILLGTRFAGRAHGF